MSVTTTAPEVWTAWVGADIDDATRAGMREHGLYDGGRTYSGWGRTTDVSFVCVLAVDVEDAHRQAVDGLAPFGLDPVRLSDPRAGAAWTRADGFIETEDGPDPVFDRLVRALS